MNKTLTSAILLCITLTLLSCGTEFDEGPSGLDCYDSEYRKSAGITTNYLETVMMKIDHYKPTGFSGIFYDPVLVYRVQENEQIGSANWIQRSYGFDIKNFEYEWGYTYELIVERREIEYSDTVMDAPGTCHILVDLVSRQKADQDTAFEIMLIWQDEHGDDSYFFNAVTGDQETGFSLFESIKLDCGDLCEQLTDQLQTEQNLTGVFNHIFDGSIKLIDLK